MRQLIFPLSLLVFFGSFVACSGDPSETPDASEDIAALKKRVTRLENRMRAMEGRGKAPGGQKPPTGPMRPVQIEGDAKNVMLTGNQRRFKLPGKVPLGKYTVVAAFGDDPPAKMGPIEVVKGDAAMLVVCMSSEKTCVVK